MMISPQRHRDHREDSQFVAGDGRAPSPCPLCLGGANLRKTNPNSRLRISDFGLRIGGNRVKQSQFRRGRAGRGPEGRWTRGQMRQTNPIWPEGPGTGKGGRQSPPGHDGAKQTQFGGGGFEMQVPLGKGVRMSFACKESRKNKANSSVADWVHASGGMPALRATTSGLRSAKCAKRTQFAGAVSDPMLADCAKQTQLGASRTFEQETHC